MEGEYSSVHWWLVGVGVARVFVGVVVGEARGKKGSGLGEEKLGLG